MGIKPLHLGDLIPLTLLYMMVSRFKQTMEEVEGVTDLQGWDLPWKLLKSLEWKMKMKIIDEYAPGNFKLFAPLQINSFLLFLFLFFLDIVCRIRFVVVVVE